MLLSSTRRSDPQLERALPPSAEGAPGWAAAVFDRHGAARIWLHGDADLTDRTPVTAQTSFRWFSVTKLVTATATLALVDRGLLRLDDPVARHVPWFHAPSASTHDLRDVTIAHLLAHRSGLADPLSLGWVHPPERHRRTPSELVRQTFARHPKLERAPGAAARYTNLGYLLLGEVVRRVTNLSFNEHVRRSVLLPAGIATAGFEPRGAVGHERLRSVRTAAMAALFLPRTRRLVAYVRDGWVGLTQFELEGQAYGGLVGSLDDLVRIGRLHLGDGAIDGVRVLSPALAARMREGQDGFGLGFWIHEGGWVGHGGEAGGYRAELRIHPERGAGVAVLANAGTANVDAVAERLGRMATRGQGALGAFTANGAS